MQVKSYNYQSIFQWSNSKNHSQLLACAQIHPDQKNLYNLDILSLDLSDCSKNLNVVGNAFYNVPFRCIAWDTFGQKQNTYPNGIIFGGMEDGSYTLWNASDMINNYNKEKFQKSEESIELQSAFLYGEESQEGSYPIICSQWNSLKNNYLAFGSTDLLILDIGKDISNPQIKKPGNRNPHQGSYITSVSWNKEVANILASASENGLIALWDIKGNKSIFQFKDSPSSNNGSGARNVVICWSKTISTQLAVTLDDQKRNQLQIWDLRNQKGPVAVFDRGHTKGINTMQWCETDPDLILTGGRDNRVVCWNYTQQQGPISSYSLNSPVYDIKWSKKLKSIYAASLEDKLQIYSLDNTNLFSYVPKSYKVPIGTNIFGNQSIMKYSESQGQRLVETKISESNPFSQNSLTTLLKQLESALDEGSFEQKSKTSQFWNLISIKNGDNKDQTILDYLGFNKQKIIKEVEKYTGKKRQSPHHAKTEIQPKNKNTKAYTPVVGLQAASFFASIGQNQMKTSKLSNQQNQQQSQSIKYDMVPRNPNWNIGKQRLIKHNILIGNYQGAIDAAIKCGRTAQALIIAYSVDQNTFNSTLKTFFTQTTDNFITDVLKNITYRDNQELVKKYDIQAWKECVSLIYSISTSDKRNHLLNLLASRIREQNLKKTNKKGDNNELDIVSQDNPAIQCYILSENFDQIANLYFQNLKNFQSGTLSRKKVVLQYAKRLILIFNSLTIQIIPNKNFQKIIRQAAYIATQQNFKMVSYIIFSHYLYDSSMRQVDMIINATKNLEQYRNSIVFKQINIPVMQFKQNKPQNNQNVGQSHGQGQKVKRGPPQQNVQNLQNDFQSGNNQQGNMGTVRGNQSYVNQNPNVPTKDKTSVPRPPIFNAKKQQQKQITPQVPTMKTPVSNKTPPPPIRNKGPQVVQPSYNQVNPQSHSNYQQQQQEPTDNFTKNKPKKVPPPPIPGAKSVVNQTNSNQKLVPPPGGNRFSQSQHHQQQEEQENPHQHYHQSSGNNNNVREYESQKKPVVPQPPFKNTKKVPPPPPVGLNQSMDVGRERQQQASFMSTQHHAQTTQHQSKKNLPPPPASKMMVPPPTGGRNNMPKPPIMNQQLGQRQENEEYENQPVKMSQHHVVSTNQSRVKPPPSPGVHTQQKVHVVKTQGFEQNPASYFNQQKDSQQSYNQPYTGFKKTGPPPPPIKKQHQPSTHEQSYENSGSRINIQSAKNMNYAPNHPVVNNTSIKSPPPPPVMKSNTKSPPPPVQQAKIQPPQSNNQFVGSNDQGRPQKYHQQQAYEQQQDQRGQQQMPIVKKPPPPVSGKKPMPPPPKR